MSVLELTNNILPEPYNIQEQANHENTVLWSVCYILTTVNTRPFPVITQRIYSP